MSKSRKLRGESTATVGAPINTLVQDPSYFTGRTEAVSRLLALIKGAGVTGQRIGVHSVEGLGGVGKTTLVLHVAHLVRSQYPDGALYIELRGSGKERDQIGTSNALAVLLSSLGFSGQAIPEQLEARASLWRNVLAEARVLVILDNAAGPDQIRPLLAGGPGCLFLITSRQRLIDLDGVSSLPLDVLTPDDASALFEKILGPDRAAGHAEEIAEVVRRIGCLPLAVRLVAKRLLAHPTLGIADVLEDVRQDGSLDRIYTDCYDDLSRRLKRFMRMLAAHPGTDLTPETAAALAGEPLPQARRMLDVLYNRFLIEEPLPHRYRFHDLIADLIRQEAAKMTNTIEHKDATRRLLQYYVSMSALASEGIGNHDLFDVDPPSAIDDAVRLRSEGGALKWYDGELANLLASSSYACHRSLMPFAWQIPASMTSYLRLRGFTAEAVSGLGDALEALTRHPDAGGEAVVRRRIGHIARLQGDDYGFSRAQLDASLRLTTRIGDRNGIAWCHHELGHVDRAVKHFDDSYSHFTEALEIQRELGDQAAIGAEETNLGITLYKRNKPGDWDAARTYLDDAIQLAEDQNDSRAKAFALYNLGAIDRDSGEIHKARALFNEALAIYERAGNRHGQADCHLHLAKTDKISGNYTSALQHLEQAQRIYLELRYRDSEAETFEELASVAAAAGDHVRADMYLDRARSTRATRL